METPDDTMIVIDRARCPDLYGLILLIELYIYCIVKRQKHRLLKAVKMYTVDVTRLSTKRKKCHLLSNLSHNMFLRTTALRNDYRLSLQALHSSKFRVLAVMKSHASL